MKSIKCKKCLKLYKSPGFTDGLCNPCYYKYPTTKYKAKKKKVNKSVKIKPVSNNWEVSCVDCQGVISLNEFLLGNGMCQICCENKYVDIVTGQNSKKKKKRKESKMSAGAGGSGWKNPAPQIGISEQFDLETLGIPKELWLPDGDRYVNRFYVKSDSSDNNYIVSQDSSINYAWVCSCPGGKRFRKCKHLKKLGLIPTETVNTFASGYTKNSNIPTAGELKAASFGLMFNGKKNTNIDTNIESSTKVAVSKRKITLDD